MELHVLRVFAAADGTGGNPLGVVLDGGSVPAAERQDLAARLGFSETVFVDDAGSGKVVIYTPAAELPLAGHPLVGAAWLLARSGCEVALLRPPAGEVATFAEGVRRFIRACPEWAPAMELRRLASPAEVEAFDSNAVPASSMLEVWAYADEPAGHIRARVFAPRLGIREDEATGSAALRLVAALWRPIVIHQGRGSELVARPAEGGFDGSVSALGAAVGSPTSGQPGARALVEVGGRVVLDEVRQLR